MSVQVVRPVSKGVLYTNAHPVGCARLVDDMWQAALDEPRPAVTDKTALVIGSSAGYGMALTVAAAVRGIQGIGVALESAGRRTATAGWYRTAQLARHARDWDWINGNAFDAGTKKTVLDAVRDRGGLDYLIYSLAAPSRIHPETGQTYRSVLKPVGAPAVLRTLAFDGAVPTVGAVRLEAATPAEIEATVEVMGGGDWELWVRALADAGLVREGFTTVALSYVGSPLTEVIYRQGTIGAAKAHLEETGRRLDSQVLDGSTQAAYTVVAGAAVTQASTHIPSIALYGSLLRRELGDGMVDPLHQGIDLWDQLTGERPMNRDDLNRIRLDDWELNPSVQEALTQRWDRITTDNAFEVADTAWFRTQVEQLYGFDVPGVDYAAEVETEVPWPAGMR